MKYETILTEDNKITVPDLVVKVLGLQPGDKVIFDVQGKSVYIRREQK